MTYALTLTGKTYGIKEVLKGLGFRWNPDMKAWKAIFNSKEEAEEIASRWASEGVYGKVEQKVEKKYFVKESWIFNLESMHDKVWCLIIDMRDGKISAPFDVAGITVKSENDLFELLDEASYLEGKAKSNRGVTGKEYGRIKDMVAWRVNARYATCMANGMSEADAGKCFEDM